MKNPFASPTPLKNLTENIAIQLISEKLWIAPSTLQFIKIRRNWSYLFKNEINWTMIRLWAYIDTKKEYESHKIFESISAKLGPLYQISNIWFYEEENIGDKVLWDKFRKTEWMDRKLVPESDFKKIISNFRELLKIQISKKVTINNDDLKESLYINDLKKEIQEAKTLPEWIDINIFNKLIDSIEYIIDYELENFSLWQMHWDLNMFNFTEKWIIDFEETRISIVWLDTINIMMHNIMFGRNNFSKVAYIFSEDQINEFFNVHKEVTGENIEDTFAKLFILRVPWWISWLQDIPDFRKTRFQQVEIMLTDYFNWNFSHKYILDTSNNYIKKIIEENKILITN